MLSTLRAQSRGFMRLRRQRHSLVWEIHFKHGVVVEAQMDRIVEEAEAWGVHREDMMVAITEIIDNDHDYADFGVLKTFLFTAKDVVNPRAQ